MTRILIVDDNHINLLTLQSQLKRLGLKADTAQDGRTALELHQRNPYTIVLLDQYMPDIPGSDLGWEIRQLDRGSNRHTHLFSISADSDTETSDAFSRLGVVRHFKKPVTHEVLAEALATWITQHPLDADTRATQGPASSHINWSELNKWLPSNTLERQQFLKEFTRITADGIQAIENAIADNNHSRIGQEAHRLKAPPKAFGMTLLSSALEQMQYAASRLASGEELLSLLVLLRQHHDSVQAEITKQFSTTHPLPHETEGS